MLLVKSERLGDLGLEKFCSLLFHKETKYRMLSYVLLREIVEKGKCDDAVVRDLHKRLKGVKMSAHSATIYQVTRHLNNAGIVEKKEGYYVLSPDFVAVLERIGEFGQKLLSNKVKLKYDLDTGLNMVKAPEFDS
jgi:hypothetical protein